MPKITRRNIFRIMYCGYCPKCNFEDITKITIGKNNQIATRCTRCNSLTTIEMNYKIEPKVGDTEQALYEQLKHIHKNQFSTPKNYWKARNKLIIRLFFEFDNYDLDVLSETVKMSISTIADIIKMRFTAHVNLYSLRNMREIIIAKRNGYTDDEIIDTLKVDQSLIELSKRKYIEFKKRYTLEMDILNW